METQNVSAFLIQFENEVTVKCMVRFFKEKNPKRTDVKVILADKDMTEREIFKTELRQFQLEICLFHVL